MLIPLSSISVLSWFFLPFLLFFMWYVYKICNVYNINQALLFLKAEVSRGRRD